MKKVETETASEVIGGDRCKTAGGMMLGFAGASLSVPTPATWALGITIGAVGAVMAISC